MTRSVKLDALPEVLTELDYPISREEAAAACADVRLELADGEENLGDTVARSSDDRFDFAEDLGSEVMNLLLRHAVGEPYQSEGEG